MSNNHAVHRYVDGIPSRRITREGAATRLHVVDECQVWLDTDIGDCDGLVIGIGDDRAEAIKDAIAELEDRLVDLKKALRTETNT